MNPDLVGFGSIILARFPFTDLSGDKRRPALVVSATNLSRAERVVCFITSVPRSGPGTVQISPDPGTGLKTPSVVRFDKIATLHLSVIAGRLGAASNSWLKRHRDIFFAVFGFDPD